MQFKKTISSKYGNLRKSVNSITSITDFFLIEGMKLFVFLTAGRKSKKLSTYIHTFSSANGCYAVPMSHDLKQKVGHMM